MSAPSGAGKTSVLFETLKNHPEISFSVSSTTRPPREGEREGVNYHYVTDSEFDNLVGKGEFLEWNTVHGKRYGTSKKAVSDVLERNGIVILDTDTVGAFNIRSHFPDAVLVFILPPSPGVLRDRLLHRDTETDDLIERRLNNSRTEIRHMAKYDYIIINDDLSAAAKHLDEIIMAEKLKRSRVFPTLSEWRDYIDG